MRASLVVLDADRRRHRHALQHLQHHTQGLFPLFPRTITSVFFKIVWLFPRSSSASAESLSPSSRRVVLDETPKNDSP